MTNSPKLQALSNAVDRDLNADRRFFKRRPDRSYRVRRAFRSELAVLDYTGGIPKLMPPGYRWHVAVKQLAPGVRFRIFLAGPPDSMDDADERLAKLLYDRFAPRQTADIEAAFAPHDGGAE